MTSPLIESVRDDVMRMSDPALPGITPRTLGERIALLPPDQRSRLFAGMSDEAIEAILFDWRGIWAREAQLAPPPVVTHDANGVAVPWTHWGIIAGRGAGKTRSAAEFIKEEVEAGRMKRIAFVGRTASDVRDTMIEGESGFLSLWPARRMPKYQPSKRRIICPNGARITAFTSKEPNMLRGPQHDGYWGDELGSWIYPMETWDNLMFGLRLGVHPRGVFTTTPKPIKLIRRLMGVDREAPPDNGSVVLAPRMSTYDNVAHLAENFIREILTKYQGTRQGRQELMGELLLDVPGALWTLAKIDEHRERARTIESIIAAASRVVVAVDPAVTNKDESAETGITVIARVDSAAFNRLGPRDERVPHYYLLRDLSGRFPVRKWSRRVVRAYYKYRADVVVGEVNNGGDLVEATIKSVDANVPFRAVWASRGKTKRAEDVSMLAEQGRIHHVGEFPELEDQLITWVPGEEDEDASPDRGDSFVWGVKGAMRGERRHGRGRSGGPRSGGSGRGSFSVG